MIPERFREKIITHATAVYVIDGYPLMLAIQGAPGTGKSYQTTEVLRQAGFAVIRVSAAKFQGKHEGDGNRLLEAEYRAAIKTAVDPDAASPAILIEDFDLSTAVRREGVTQTVNSNLLNGFLMHLSDNVSTVFPDNPIRIPLFLTGNDFSLLYGPLARHGRLDVFTWEPAPHESTEILASLLDGVIESPECGARAIIAELELFNIASLKFALDRVRATWNYRQLVESPEFQDLGTAKLQDLKFHPMSGMSVDDFVEWLCREYRALERPANHLAPVAEG